MKRLILIAMVVLLLSSIILAKDFCKGDFNYNGSVGAEEVETFLEHFGRSQFNNSCPPDGPAPVEKTGQTTSYATGDDGDHQRGVAFPNPRFTDNLDGTVTDNNTGLVWLKDAFCDVLNDNGDAHYWGAAMWAVTYLNDGFCNLTDGSSEGDWRLPTKEEWEAFICPHYTDPAVCNTDGTGQWSEGDPFTNVQSGGYWSSTTFASNTRLAWLVGIHTGFVNHYNKANYHYCVWPVRGGH